VTGVDPGGALAPPVVPGVTDLVEVGRGGFGVVYRARQPELGRDVAVKVLLAPGMDERAVHRWRREVTAMGRLSNHPNIVGAFSTGVTATGHPYLLMPYAAGGSLHERIARHGPLAPAEAARIGARLAGALTAAHAAGVLHRDVKPANVLFSEYGEPQLSDFGIARLADAATTATGSVQATIGYAAPEILSGGPSTPAADVYGLGATLHAALSGQAPFAGLPGEPLVGRVGRVVTQPPPDLRPLGVPPALAELVDRCLAKDPDARPASAEELGVALEALAAGPPPDDGAPTRPLAPPPDAPPEAPAGRRGVLAVAVVALLLVLAGAGWLLTRDDGEGRAGPAAATVAGTTEGAPASPPGTEAPEGTAAPGSTEPRAELSVPEGTEPPGSDPEPDPGATAPAGEAAYRDAVDRYYQLVRAGDLEASWSRLSPRFQAEQTYEGYVAYWTETIASVEVRGRPRIEADAARAELTLRYVRTDGVRTTETVTLTFVPGSEGGPPLIDDYVVQSSE